LWRGEGADHGLHGLASCELFFQPSQVIHHALISPWLPWVESLWFIQKIVRTFRVSSSHTDSTMIQIYFSSYFGISIDQLAQHERGRSSLQRCRWILEQVLASGGWRRNRLIICIRLGRRGGELLTSFRWVWWTRSISIRARRTAPRSTC
jgi:hypothetical protein